MNLNIKNIKNIKNLKKEIVKFARLADNRGYTVASEGNISYKLGENRFLITPTRKIKAFLEPKDLVIIDRNGNKVNGSAKPTSERFTHLAIYQERPDINCIIHAHPIYTTLLTSANIIPGESPLLSESAMFIKNARLLPFARPSTSDGARSVKNACSNSDILLISRHGSFTYGKDLFTSFSLLELLEKTARFEYMLRQSDLKVSPLTREQIEDLKRISY